MVICFLEVTKPLCYNANNIRKQIPAFAPVCIICIRGIFPLKGMDSTHG